MVLSLGLCLLWALAVSQEICSSPGDLPAPTLIQDKGSSHSGDNVILLCFVPMDTSVTHVIFCKDGKEMLMLPKDRNKFIFESAQPVSPESTGEYSCRYQHKDDRNQEKTSLPSTRRYLSAPGGPSLSGSDSSGAEPSSPGDEFSPTPHSSPGGEHYHSLEPGSLVTSQEICSSPGTLPAPWLFLDRLSAHQGDIAMLSCLVPLDAPMTRIVFCKDGKEISVQLKEGNKLVYDSPHPVSRESAGAFSCRYQLNDDNNQENNSLPSDSWHLHVADGDGSGEGTLFQGLDITLWVWILRSTLVLVLLVSAPIITCILRKRAIAQPVQKAMGGNGREEE